MHKKHKESFTSLEVPQESYLNRSFDVGSDLNRSGRVYSSNPEIAEGGSNRRRHPSTESMDSSYYSNQSSSSYSWQESESNEVTYPTRSITRQSVIANPLQFVKGKGALELANMAKIQMQVAAESKREKTQSRALEEDDTAWQNELTVWKNRRKTISGNKTEEKIGQLKTEETGGSVSTETSTVSSRKHTESNKFDLIKDKGGHVETTLQEHRMNLNEKAVGSVATEADKSTTDYRVHTKEHGNEQRDSAEMNKDQNTTDYQSHAITAQKFQETGSNISKKQLDFDELDSVSEKTTSVDVIHIADKQSKKIDEYVEEMAGKEDRSLIKEATDVESRNIPIPRKRHNNFNYTVTDKDTNVTNQTVNKPNVYSQSRLTELPESTHKTVIDTSSSLESISRPVRGNDDSFQNLNDISENLNRDIAKQFELLATEVSQPEDKRHEKFNVRINSQREDNIQNKVDYRHNVGDDIFNETKPEQRYQIDDNVKETRKDSQSMFTSLASIQDAKSPSTLSMNTSFKFQSLVTDTNASSPLVHQNLIIDKDSKTSTLSRKLKQTSHPSAISSTTETSFQKSLFEYNLPKPIATSPSAVSTTTNTGDSSKTFRQPAGAGQEGSTLIIDPRNRREFGQMARPLKIQVDVVSRTKLETNEEVDGSEHTKSVGEEERKEMHREKMTKYDARLLVLQKVGETMINKQRDLSHQTASRERPYQKEQKETETCNQKQWMYQREIESIDKQEEQSDYNKQEDLLKTEQQQIETNKKMQKPLIICNQQQVFTQTQEQVKPYLGKEHEGLNDHQKQEGIYQTQEEKTKKQKELSLQQKDPISHWQESDKTQQETYQNHQQEDNKKQPQKEICQDQKQENDINQLEPSNPLTKTDQKQQQEEVFQNQKEETIKKHHKDVDTHKQEENPYHYVKEMIPHFKNTSEKQDLQEQSLESTEVKSLSQITGNLLWKPKGFESRRRKYSSVAFNPQEVVQSRSRSHSTQSTTSHFTDNASGLSHDKDTTSRFPNDRDTTLGFPHDRDTGLIMGGGDTIPTKEQCSPYQKVQNNEENVTLNFQRSSSLYDLSRISPIACETNIKSVTGSDRGFRRSSHGFYREEHLAINRTPKPFKATSTEPEIKNHVENSPITDYAPPAAEVFSGISDSLANPLKDTIWDKLHNFNSPPGISSSPFWYSAEQTQKLPWQRTIQTPNVSRPDVKWLTQETPFSKQRLQSCGSSVCDSESPSDVFSYSWEHNNLQNQNNSTKAEKHEAGFTEHAQQNTTTQSYPTFYQNKPFSGQSNTGFDSYKNKQIQNSSFTSISSLSPQSPKTFLQQGHNPKTRSQSDSTLPPMSPLYLPQTLHQVPTYDSHMCSYCGQDLGLELAMKIESLNLHFHANCFRCFDCHVTIGAGGQRAEVRVKAKRLLCTNCYSGNQNVFKF